MYARMNCGSLWHGIIQLSHIFIPFFVLLLFLSVLYTSVLHNTHDWELLFKNKSKASPYKELEE